ncbi:MAG: class I SAM-dependent methyltransferase [bacterium]|nr:class I SAM-dependent methyltransferase [bacterium]
MSEGNRTSARRTDEDLEGRAELCAVLARAKIVGQESRFVGEPKDVLDRLVAEVSETTVVYSEEELRALPNEGPLDFELYLLSRMHEMPRFVGAAKRDGGLRVMESIRCLRDRIRTKKFLRGVAEAVATLDDGREIIRLCDAGCGAIPVQAMVAAFMSPRVRCTCIEVNEYSAYIARNVVASFGLQDRITIVRENATTFVHDDQFDLLVSETMHAALTAEPIVQIMTHLRPFVTPGGIVLPSAIIVRAAVMRAAEYEHPRGYVSLYGDPQYYVEPDWKTVVTYHPGDALDVIEFTIPIPDMEGDYVVLITSEVDIGRQHLSPYQSLITTPQALREPDGNFRIFHADGNAPHARVRVQYQPGDLLEDIQSVSER